MRKRLVAAGLLVTCMLAACVVAGGDLVRGADDDTTAPPALDSTAAADVGRMITLSDFGAEDLAYLAVPSVPPSVGIVLVPDAYGLDDFTKREADRLATLGYLVIAVDIYNGRQTIDPGDLANLVANLNSETILKTIDAGVRFFHDSPKFHCDHVIAMGWGTGATYVFQEARENKSLDGAITFYGPIIGRDHLVGKFSAALCAVYPQNDPVNTHDSVLAFQRATKAAGNDCEAWFIAAGTGWSNPKSSTYNPGEDKEAWKVAVPFIVRIGAEPVRVKRDTILDKAKDKIESIFK